MPRTEHAVPRNAPVTPSPIATSSRPNTSRADASPMSDSPTARYRWNPWSAPRSTDASSHRQPVGIVAAAAQTASTPIARGQLFAQQDRDRGDREGQHGDPSEPPAHAGAGRLVPERDRGAHLARDRDLKRRARHLQDQEGRHQRGERAVAGRAEDAREHHGEDERHDVRPPSPPPPGRPRGRCRSAQAGCADAAGSGAAARSASSASSERSRRRVPRERARALERGTAEAIALRRVREDRPHLLAKFGHVVRKQPRAPVLDRLGQAAHGERGGRRGARGRLHHGQAPALGRGRRQVHPRALEELPLARLVDVPVHAHAVAQAAPRDLLLERRAGGLPRRRSRAPRRGPSRACRAAARFACIS